MEKPVLDVVSNAMEPKPVRKTGIVRSVVEVKPGAIVEFNDFQIASSTPDGVIRMANFDIYESKNKGHNEIYKIVEGVWRITPKLGIQPIHFSENVYYETPTTTKLFGIFERFKKNLHVFEELGIKKKKRGILLGSRPGCGKSSLISYFCRKLSEEPNACVLFIDSQSVDYETVQDMFRKASESTVKFIVLVIEDIGGSDLNERRHNVDSTMLNFLDGSEGLYDVPTLIIGTTNYLDELGETLTSRPGRFDVVEVVAPPKDEECIKLTEQFAKRQLSQSEKDAISGKGFTPAYLMECVIRHKLDDISLEEAVKELEVQRTLSEEKVHMHKKSRMGFTDE